MSAHSTVVALAACFWGISGGIGGMLMAQGWDAFVVSFYRGGIGCLFVLIWLALRPRRSGLSKGRLWFWSTIAGIGIAGNFSFYFISIAQGSVAVAVTLMYCAPVFVYLVACLLKLERATTLKSASIVVVLLAIVLLTGIYDIGAGSISLIGVGAGLLAGISYTIFLFAFKYAAPHGTPQAILSIAFAVLALLLIGPSHADQTLAVWHTPDWPLFAALGVFGAGLSFMLYISGLHHTTPTTAAIVAMVEPVTATLFGVLILHERLTGIQLLGMILILVTVTATQLRRPTAVPLHETT